MKTLLLVFSMVSSLTFAFETIEVKRQAHPVRVNSVKKEIVGEHGFPSTRVLVNATFGNSCEVPREDELVSITQYTSNYNTLLIALGNESDRACPAVYRPVTVTIDLGVFTKPNDGLFSKIIVNGKTAK